jgi:5-oxoprolinase (ATP-hydrolysing) subunit A
VIDLSADLGEGSHGEETIWTLITSANVACGGHTGDDASMAYAACQARDLNVRLGAHPSYPDRENFGRKPMAILPFELRASLTGQIDALRAIAVTHGVRMTHVKPHGALYNQAHHDAVLAGVIVDAMRDVDGALALVCPASSQMAVAARLVGMGVIREAFADRRYEPDGALVARGTPGALLTVVEAADQAGMLAREGAVISRDGSRIAVAFDTVCVHSDMDGAVERLKAIRDRLAGIEALRGW